MFTSAGKISEMNRKKDRKHRVSTLLFPFLLTIGIPISLLYSHAGSQLVIIALFFTLLMWILHIRKFLLISDEQRIPVLMYHSVSPSFTLIPNRGLSVSPELFEAHMSYLKNNNYKVVFLDSIVSHMKQKEILSGKTIAITFDDGYRDNYEYAFPILKKFGSPATIFMSTDFIRNDTPPDIPGLSISRHPCGDKAYLSWQEINELEKSGLIKVESHGKSHRYRFKNDTLSGFFTWSNNKYYWYIWDLYPDLKPYWHMISSGKGVGHPIFEEAPALSGLKFKPDEELIKNLEKAASSMEQNSTEFKNKLMDLTEKYRNEKGELGKYETENEFRDRLLSELRESKQKLEKGLSRKIQIFAWPNDATPNIWDIALKEAGYSATTAGDHYNRPGDFDGKISRIYTGARLMGLDNIKVDTLFFGFELKLFEGNYLYYLPIMFSNILQKFIKRN